MNGPSADSYKGHGVVIHFSDRFPVERTPCGTLGPSAAVWRYVDCLAWLDKAPDDPRIRERTQCPAEYAAVAALVAAGSVVGRGCAIRPKHHDEWSVIRHPRDVLRAHLRPTRCAEILPPSNPTFAGREIIPRPSRLVRSGRVELPRSYDHQNLNLDQSEEARAK